MPVHAFHQYAAAGDLASIKRLISHGTSPAQRDAEGQTPLHAAARAGQTKAVELLIQRYPAALSMTDKDGRLPLHHAVESSDATVKAILKHVPSGQCSHTDDCGRTPFMRAVCRPSIRTVKLMLDAGAVVNNWSVSEQDTPPGGDYPLTAALARGDGPMARLLLGAGADVDILSGAGASPLDLAVGAMDFETLHAITDPDGSWSEMNPEEARRQANVSFNRILLRLGTNTELTEPERRQNQDMLGCLEGVLSSAVRAIVAQGGPTQATATAAADIAPEPGAE